MPWNLNSFLWTQTSSLPIKEKYSVNVCHAVLWKDWAPFKSTPTKKDSVVKAEVTVNCVTVSSGNKWGRSIMPNPGYMDMFRETLGLSAWNEFYTLYGWKKTWESNGLSCTPLSSFYPTSNWTYVHRLIQLLHLELMSVSLTSAHKG